MMMVTAAAMAASSAKADDLEDAHRQALAGRDSYWNCLAQQYTRDDNTKKSEPDFVSLIAGVCPSERQNFRVSLVDYLVLQFPDVDAGAHLTTANHAIELAQKDIVTAFIKRRGAVK
jgi:hypothetical protein